MSPRSSDRGSIAAAWRQWLARPAPTVTAVLGPRLHCGCFQHDMVISPSSCHRGPRTAAPLRPDVLGLRAALELVSPRSSDRGSIAAASITPGTAACQPSPRSSDRGSIAASATWSVRTSRCSSHRGPRTAAPLRRASRAHRRCRLGRVTAVLGPRLHCGLTPGRTPRRAGVCHRGPRTAAPLRPHAADVVACVVAGVTAVLGPRLHCGDDNGELRYGFELWSPRSSDRGSIAAPTRRPGR